MALISPNPRVQIFDANGDPLVGGKIYTYAAGTTTPIPTYTDYFQVSQNPNPIILDAAGTCSIWIDSANSYKFVVKDANDTLLYTTDYINQPPLDWTALNSSLGASYVGFTQGVSNAVATTVQSALRETVSVFRFMTEAQKNDVRAGTASIDVTTAINNAIAFVSAQPRRWALYFPAGMYLVTSTIFFNFPEVKVFGDGRTNSVIKYTGSSIAVAFTNANPNNGAYTFGGQIEDIGIQGNPSSTSLLYIKNVNHFLARNVNLYESSTTVGVGLHVVGTVAGYFENIVCSTNAQLMNSRPSVGVLVDRDPTTLSRATDNIFINLIIEGMYGDGIQLDNSDQSLFLGGTSENNSGNGVTIAAGSRMNTFISVGFEHSASTTFADVYDGGFSNRFINCYTSKLFYAAASSLFLKLEGGFHQSIDIVGDFPTVDSLKYSFFSAGGTYTVSNSASTRNVFNASTSALVFPAKSTITVVPSGSPFTYTNLSGLDENVIISGGTVSQIVFSRGGPITTVPVAGMYRLAPNDALIISYSVAPTIVRVPYGTTFI